MIPHRRPQRGHESAQEASSGSPRPKISPNRCSKTFKHVLGGRRLTKHVICVFPRNRRGGVLFRFYTGSVLTFVSFCCNPFPFSSSTARIARSRRGEAIRGVGPLNGVGVEIWFRSLSKEIPPTQPRTLPRGSWTHRRPFVIVQRSRAPTP